MEIFSSDYKHLSIDTEKGKVYLLLPIGITLEDALKVSMNFTGTLTQTLDLYNQKKEENDDDSDADKSSARNCEDE